MFPTFFENCDSQQLSCDACEFAKHTRVAFPVSDNKSITLFHIVHSDVWGPSRVVSLNGYRWCDFH